MVQLGSAAFLYTKMLVVGGWESHCNYNGTSDQKRETPEKLAISSIPDVSGSNQ